MLKLNELNKHAKDMLVNNYKIKSDNKILIIYDENTKISPILKNSFEHASKDLKNDVETLKYYEYEPENIMSKIEENYNKDDIIVLAQSTSFRASKFRWRNILCSMGLKVVEFGHLGKVLEEEYDNFIDSLTYDMPHYKKVIAKVEPLLEKSKSIKVVCVDGSEINYDGLMDKIIKNDGDFEGHTNYGSRFPIGEIISEGLELSSLSGKVQVYAYPNTSQETKFVEPFNCVIEKGFLISHDGPEEFNEIVELIKTEHPEGKVYVREFGLGLNRNIKRFGKISEPIAYERQEGLHFSLGMKHGIYDKKLKPVYGKKFYQRYHIDIYINVAKIYIESELIYTYEDGLIV